MAEKIAAKKYWLVWIVLELMTGLSYGLSRISMGPGDVILPLLIAAAQTMLVLLYFMHLRFSEPLTRLAIGAGFLWLVIMVDLTLADYLTRGTAWPLFK